MLENKYILKDFSFVLYQPLEEKKNKKIDDNFICILTFLEMHRYKKEIFDQKKSN